MKIKRTVSTYIQKQSSSLEEYTIRTSIRWRENNRQQCVAVNVGHTISPDKWDSESSRVKKRVSNKKYISYSEVNKDIQKLEDVIDNAFKKFEVEERIPSKIQLRDTINLSLGKNVGRRSEMSLVQDAFGIYVLDLSNRKTLSDSTYAKLKTVKNILKEYNPNLALHEITSDKLDEYVSYLILDRDMQNTTVKKNLSFVRSFLEYCNSRNLIDTDWKTHIVELKTVQGKNIIFLDLDEFEKVYSFQFPENKKYLERARDVFAFQCVTALRYSDVKALKKIDIAEDKINPIVTEKTDTYLNIPLNTKAKEILAKYANIKGEYALPVQSNQKMNDYIKEVCYLVGISQPVTNYYYKGKELISKTFSKHEKIGTHTARRSFICIALASGVPPHVVMRITGHSDYKSMQPYIDATSQAKIEAVSVFN